MFLVSECVLEFYSVVCEQLSIQSDTWYQYQVTDENTSKWHIGTSQKTHFAMYSALP